MDSVIIEMLKSYEPKTDDEYENSLKQIIQQIALLGLWRGKFFEHAAFYGGTALRILYGLDRFSEDLDFSLLKPNSDFSLQPYLDTITEELKSFGFTVEISIKKKSNESPIESAFLKENTKEHFLKIDAPNEVQQQVHRFSLLKIKIEVDILPPLGFNTETKLILSPIPFWVKSYTLPDLFAGKISAVLCRNWGKRVKGRDFYDFLWFLQKHIPVHLRHLETRLREFGFYSDKSPITEEILKSLLISRFKQLDVKLAKDDIVKFIKQPHRLDNWSNELFISAVNELKCQ